ncbi:ISNCY family transposase [Streptococcus dysgalactiae subsp. equisimilis]|uniref:ISNCY family transposase n=1 Tax=Streptococcus dysgalactiae TaxID=1334 RepID=UPI001F139679|nr:ISNCY family transposase [Streptococcus dysgalactiae]MCL6222803.1 ISNCY family transposase [Streptococcus dysgalactiae subsp. equisimilis]UMY69058.1 ISNCY family transposase [Streptococcus dysgalactiae subsp. equisimilis]UMY69075.1 ISNCY family transposase [Streptococcus dysgalactiae subsp. equisimilis]UMY69088.1 ISNCY family transposase [Streptococcus dysgalactiae subsp. equisimilis]UMY69089.1 ISNCY family transposase [Streptococcus dysgalactiae subsp. equisimilis]
MTEHKKYLVIKAVAEGKKKKHRACVELSLSIRQVNRLLITYKEKGKEAFRHGNRHKKPRHTIPIEIKEKIIEKYKGFGPIKPNVVHFCELLSEEGICYSDTTIRNLIYKAGFLSPKTQRKTKKRLKNEADKKKKDCKEALFPTASDFFEEPEKVHPSRARKKYRGELVQMDASQYLWFAQVETHLHLAVDDASGDIVGAYFDTQETLNGYYHVLEQILKAHGIPFQFLTDKRTVFTYASSQSKKIEEDTFTQFGYACHQLGIDIKTSSIPQAKGRVERLNQTLQSRLPIDLQRHQISTIEQANHYLKGWIKRFNKQFGGRSSLSVFEQAPKPSQRNLLLARVSERVVDNGHHIRYRNNFYLPIQGNEAVFFSRKTKVLVIEAFDGDIYLNIAERIYSTKLLQKHETHSIEFEQPIEIKKERRKYIPPQSHPWKLASFKQYLHKIGKSYEEFQAEKDQTSPLQL